jgi:large subunit ribosomal protein L13
MIMPEVYVDAGNMVAGRLASRVAKRLLKGDSVFVVNAEKAVLSGEPKHLIERYTEKIERGDPYHGPFYPKEPDRMLKRMVRGMLPYKKSSGRSAFSRLRVFISVPDEMKGVEFSRPRGAENDLKCKTMSLGMLAQKLGAKKTW